MYKYKIKRGLALTKEELINEIKEFYLKHGRYPDNNDLKKESNGFRSPRVIQRKFGGISKVKKEMGLSKEQCDSRCGSIRSKKAIEINDRNLKIESKLNKSLEQKYGIRNIRHPYTPFDDTKRNVDFLVFHPVEYKVIGLELFYPSNQQTMNGCLNAKKTKNQTVKMVLNHTSKFYYVVTNPKFKQEEIDGVIAKKKNKPDCDGVLSIDTINKWLADEIDLFN